MAGNEKVINLIIRAKDEYSRVTNAAKKTFEQLAPKQALQRQVALRSEIRELETALKTTTAEAGRYAKTMNDAAKADKLSAAESRELRDAFTLARDRAKELTVAIRDKNAELNRVRAATKPILDEAEATRQAAASQRLLQKELAESEARYKTATAAAQSHARAVSAAPRSANPEVVARRAEIDNRQSAKAEIRGLQTTMSAASAEAGRLNAILMQNAQTQRLNAADVGKLRSALDGYIVTARNAKQAISDKSIALNRASASANGSFAAFSKNASAMDATANQAERLQRELAQNTTRYKEATAAAAGYMAAQKSAPGIRNVTFGKAAIEDARDAKLAINETRAAIARLNGTTAGGFRAFSQAADAMEIQTTEALQLAPAVQQVTTASNAVVAAQRNAKTAVDATTKAIQRQNSIPQRGVGRGNGGGGDVFDEAAGSYATRQGRGPLGLRPYEVTNLSYQINDVVSGLAMGQAPAQIFAQQFGQIIQIFPKAGGAILRFLPILAALGLGVVAPMMRVKALEDSIKQFEVQLALSADGARYSAENLGLITQELDALGVSLADARKAVSAFAEAGFSEGSMKEMILIAKDLAKATGESVPDAVTKMTDAFKGGQEGVRKLDSELNFLTAAQYEQISAMFDAGKETEAYEATQAALQDRLSIVAKQADGPWSNAMRNFGQAWRNFLDWMADTALINVTTAAINKLGEAVNLVAEALANIRDKGQSNTEFLVRTEMDDASIDQMIYDIQQQLDAAKFSIVPIPDEVTKELERQLAALQALRALPLPDRAGSNLNPFTEGPDVESAEQWLARLMSAKEVADEINGKTEEQKKIQIDVNRSVAELIKKKEQEATLAGMTSKELFVHEGLLEALNIAKEKGGELDAKALENLRQRLGLTYEMISAAETTASFTGPGGAGAIGSFVDKVVGVESGNNPNATNPNSTATGLGQFIESTWLEMFKRYFPDRAAGMTEAAILALRKDAATSRAMIELYAAENAKVLQGAGVAVTEASLYLAHFLGPGGAAGLLTARPGTPVEDVLEPEQIAANKSVLQGKTTDQVLAWAQQKMGITTQELGVRERLNELDAEAAEKEKERADAYRERLADMQFELSIADKTAKAQAVAEAVRAAEKEKGLALTTAERAEVEKMAAALWDAQNADRLRKEEGKRLEAEVNLLLERQATLRERIAYFQQTGNASAAAQATAELASVDMKLAEATANARAFWEAMSGPEAAAALAALEKTEFQLAQLDTRFLMTAEQMNEFIANSATNAFQQFAQAVANGENAFQALGNAVRQIAADILMQLGQMIIKQAIFNALSAAFGGGSGGGVGGFIMKAVGAIVKHDGGLVGNSGPSRSVSPAVFANAVRYHGGGVAGLKPNEVPAILEKGEEVLTESDPRHQNNAGGAGGNISVINTIDSTSFLEEALKKSDGRRIILNFMRANQGATRQALGV